MVTVIIDLGLFTIFIILTKVRKIVVQNRNLIGKNTIRCFLIKFMLLFPFVEHFVLTHLYFLRTTRYILYTFLKFLFAKIFTINNN